MGVYLVFCVVWTFILVPSVGAWLLCHFNYGNVWWIPVIILVALLPVLIPFLLLS